MALQAVVAGRGPCPHVDLQGQSLEVSVCCLAPYLFLGGGRGEGRYQHPQSISPSSACVSSWCHPEELLGCDLGPFKHTSRNDYLPFSN